jgi:hypothetical protein
LSQRIAASGCVDFAKIGELERVPERELGREPERELGREPERELGREPERGLEGVR